MKTITSIYIEGEILDQCRKSGLNISQFVEDKLKEYLQTSEKAKSILAGERSKILEDEVQKYLEDTKNVEDWRKFLDGRVYLINKKYRIGLSRNEFEALVLEAKK